MANGKKDKIWKLKDKVGDDFKEKFPEIHPIITQLLYSRGIDSQEKVNEFLYPDYSKDLHDPYLFKDMKKAVTRIWQAIEKKEKVLVYGDYDADGVCSTALLVDFFKMLNFDVEIYIPHRETEGYGLNIDSIDSFIAQKVDLIITVDCGSTNVEEIKKAQTSGIDVIITDHHQVGDHELPAFAFLNCTNKNDDYPFANLAGVGMAFKLVQGMILSEENKKKQLVKPGQEKWLLDLVAIATVADVMPLIGENHTLVKYGMLVLNKTKRLGLLELMKIAGLKPGSIETWHLGFVIGPRLNAAGRIDHANTAYTLLVADNQTEAEKYANDLNKANITRQQLTETYVKQANEMIKEQLANEEKLLFVFEKNWDLGLVGLIAGRLADRNNRPVFILTENQGEIKGSARSIPNFSVIEATSKQTGYLKRFGGHAGACGFTLKDKKYIEDFDKGLKNEAQNIKQEDLVLELFIDAEVTLSDIDWRLLEETKKFEPFGEKNPQPVFLSKNLQVLGLDFVGDNKQHLRLMIGDEAGLVRKTIGFGLGEKWKDLQMGDRVDVVYEIGVNEWNGNRELQLKIVDLKESLSK